MEQIIPRLDHMSSYWRHTTLEGVIETARAQVADLIGAQPREIIFTSCATESNNAAIHAALKANPAKRHIVTSAVEHSSVLNYCMALEKDGYQVTYLRWTERGCSSWRTWKTRSQAKPPPCR